MDITHIEAMDNILQFIKAEIRYHDLEEEEIPDFLDELVNHLQMATAPIVA